MAMKYYSDKFRADAVALYESTPGATYKGIAANLDVCRGALRLWVLAARERRGGDPAGGPGVVHRLRPVHGPERLTGGSRRADRVAGPVGRSRRWSSRLRPR